MHGLIHLILKQLVVERFGEDKWAKIGEELGLESDVAVLEMRQYEDELTVKAVVTTAKVLGVEVEDALRVFGSFFVEYVCRGGHLRMLESMGDTLEAFMRNMNHLHYNLERAFRSSNFPYFKIHTGETRDSFYLSYCSLRGKLLAPIIEGVLPTLAEQLHQQGVTMSREEPREGAHMTWRVTTSKLDKKPELPPGSGTSGSLWHFVLASINLTCGVKCCKDDDKGDLVEEITPTLSTTGCRETVQIHNLMSGLPPEEKKKLDDLAARIDQAEDPASLLMRGVPAGRVASGWDTEDALEEVNLFWNTNAGDARDYGKSRNVVQADFFVTHSWSKPADWHAVMGERCSYGEMKATELKVAAEDAAEQRGGKWEDITFWIDKCCIPQRHTLMPRCVALIEGFLQRCGGMIVLLTWHYFSRLWCVYEWAAFLVYHDPQNVQVHVDAFMRPASRQLYLDSVANFSMAAAQCYDEEDRKYLKEKVAEYYVSEAAFEKFAKGTAVAVMAASGLRQASRGQVAYEQDYLPWVALARELGFQSIAEALDDADPLGWRQEALANCGGMSAETLGKEAKGWQAVFNKDLDLFFKARLSPVLDKLKEECVLPQVISKMSRMRSKKVPQDMAP